MSTKEEIFNYVMNTPGNTNPAVLKSLLDGMEGGERIMIPIYTMATGSSPVFVDNYDGVPGEKIAINVPWPANTGRFLGTKWDTGDSLFWVSKSVPGSSEVGHIEITGYFPMEIPDGARSIYVLFTES